VGIRLPVGAKDAFELASRTSGLDHIRLTCSELMHRIDHSEVSRISHCLQPSQEKNQKTKDTNCMANHFSALKRARQTEKRTVRNRANTSRLRSALRDLRESLAKGDKAGAEQVFRQTVSALDKAVQKGVLHENTASRYKSRLGVRLNAVGKK